MLSGLSQATVGGDTFNPDSINNVLEMLNVLLSSDAVGTTQQQEGRSRRRRNVEQDEVVLRTPEQVICMLLKISIVLFM